MEREAAGGVTRREIRARRIPRAAEDRALVSLELRRDAAARAAPDRNRAVPVSSGDEDAVRAEAAPHGVADWAKARVRKRLDGQKSAQVDNVAAAVARGGEKMRGSGGSGSEGERRDGRLVHADHLLPLPRPDVPQTNLVVLDFKL